MTERFLNAVEANRISLVRGYLANELAIDPRGKTFEEMLAYAEKKLSNLFQEDNGKTYSENISDWNEDFLMKVKNDLDSNFSRERLSFYEKITKEVLKEKARALDEEQAFQPNSGYSSTSSENEDNSKNNATSNSRSSTNNNTSLITTLAGAAVAVTGICLKSAAVITVGTIGVVAGLASSVVKNLKK